MRSTPLKRTTALKACKPLNPHAQQGTAWQLYDGQIKQMREQGLTLQMIGDIVGVTEERIRQILNDHYKTT